MKQVVLNLQNDRKADALIAFLRQMDFVKLQRIGNYEEMAKIESDVAKSLSDLKNGNVSLWKNKKVTLK
jgi:hypothetical protein